MFWYIYIVSILYCIYRFTKSYKRTSLDGVIGPTPGLETIVVLVFAPVLAVVDISITWIRYVKEVEDYKIKKNKFF